MAQPEAREATTWVVGPDSEAVISRLLALDRRSGWRLVDWRAQGSWIDARFASRSELAFVRLYPPGRRLPVAHVKTDRFTLALVRGRGQGLLAMLAQRVSAHEQGFEWQRLEPRESTRPVVDPLTRARALDAEQLGFRAGIKPGLRISCDAAGLWWDASEFQREGAAMTLMIGSLSGNEQRGILMIARSLAESEAMAVAHLDEQAREPRRIAAGTRELGRRLGYPACCVDAFISDFAHESSAKLDDDPLGRSAAEVKLTVDVWRRLDRAWVARPAPRINSLLFGERLRLISFDPCRFDCARALALADSLHDLVAAEDAEAAAELDRQLARPVVVDAADRRAWVTIVERGGSTRIGEVEPVRTDSDRPVAPEFLASLVGQRVTVDGRLPDLPGLPARVFRFDLDQG